MILNGSKFVIEPVLVTNDQNKKLDLYHFYSKQILNEKNHEINSKERVKARKVRIATESV
jgi:hypothetical protein